MAIVITCTRFRSNSSETTNVERINPHNISNLYTDDTTGENIYETMNYPDDQVYNCNKYMPLNSTYSHYRSPRHIMGNTLRRINPAMDKYSITKRKSMMGNYAINWPETRVDFLTNYKGETQSDVDIYVPMEWQNKQISKTKSADTLIRIPIAAMLLSLILSVGSIYETQAQMHKHLKDIDGTPRSQEKNINQKGRRSIAL